MLRREGYDNGYSHEGKLSHIKAQETCSAKGAFLPLSSDDMTNDIAKDLFDFKPYSSLATGKLVALAIHIIQPNTILTVVGMS